MASAQTTETKKFDTEEFDDFDAASDLCDFGFVLTPPQPAPQKRPDPVIR